MSGYQPLPTSSLLEQKSRPEGDRASGVRGGGVGRVRKKERKGREVVSCRTLDEAHARCEAARAFTRGKQEAVCVPGRDTVGPGPGGVHAVLPAFEVSYRRVDRTGQPWIVHGPADQETALLVVVVYREERTRPKSSHGPYIVDHAAHVSGTKTNRYRARPNANESPRSSLSGYPCSPLIGRNLEEVVTVDEGSDHIAT